MKRTLFCVLLLTICAGAQDAPQPAKPNAPGSKWEYTVVSSSHAADEDEKLAKLGLEGWELVSVVYVENLSGKEPFSKRPAHLRYYLKRQKAL